MKCLACRVAGLLLAASIALIPASIIAADDALSQARDLYAQAAYEEALAMLNRLRSPEGAAQQDLAIEQYRAMCLLALGRSDEAQHAIEIVVTAEPSFTPSDADVSPRVRSAFSDVRRRLLPTIVQQKYVLAKAAFDRKEFAEAAQAFGQVINMLGDPDLGAAASQSLCTGVAPANAAMKLTNVANSGLTRSFGTSYRVSEDNL